MSPPTYTIKQLRALQNSPLVKKPDQLPSIDQWIEQSQDQNQRRHSQDHNQRRSRTLAGLQDGKKDENENPAKRPALHEHRHSSRQLNSDEIWLGPKSSLNAVSAARQQTQEGVSLRPPDDRSTHERVISRERPSRDRDGRYETRDQFLPDERQAADTRPKNRLEAWKTKTRERIDGEMDAEQDKTSRRQGFDRSKFDQPWLRPGPKPNIIETDGNIEHNVSRGWRDKDWIRGNASKEPQWMKDPKPKESAEPSQEDFEKWRQERKLGESAATVLPENDEPTVSEAQANEDASTLPTFQTQKEPETLFGQWGEKKRDSGPIVSQNTVKAGKASRFAGFFGAPKPQAPQPSIEPEETEPTSPVIQQRPPRNTAEDQEGFQRMMEMLRLGGGTGPGPTISHAYGPPSFNGSNTGPPIEVSQMSDVASPSSHMREVTESELRGQRNTNDGPSRAEHNVRQQVPTRDSEFLLKLMQQPRGQFNEHQIYGRDYNRKETPELSLLHQLARPNPYPQAHREASSGFLDQSRVYTGNAQFVGDANMVPDATKKTSPFAVTDDRPASFSPVQQAHHDEVFHQRRLDPRFQNHNSFEQIPHGLVNRPGNPDHLPPPPPGFFPGRGQPPPGLIPFANGAPSNNPAFRAGPHNQPINIFGNQSAGQAPPPGLPPHPHGVNAPQNRRPLMPPGFDGYDGDPRRVQEYPSRPGPASNHFAQHMR